LPSGNQRAPSASVEISVIRFGSPVKPPEAESKSCVHTWELLPRGLMKRNFLPSGDQRPPVSPAGSEGSCSALPPARGTIHRWEVRLLAFKSTSTAENRTHLPSGEITGPPIRLSAIMSSKVKGRLPPSAACEKLWQTVVLMNTMNTSAKRRILPPQCNG